MDEGRTKRSGIGWQRHIFGIEKGKKISLNSRPREPVLEIEENKGLTDEEPLAPGQLERFPAEPGSVEGRRAGRCRCHLLLGSLLCLCLTLLFSYSALQVCNLQAVQLLLPRSLSSGSKAAVTTRGTQVAGAKPQGQLKARKPGPPSWPFFPAASIVTRL